jgi:hypothetical protein
MTDVHIEGWKGKDKIQIKEECEFYIVHEHRKDKETGKVNTASHHIPKKNVNNLMNILANTEPKDDKYTYRDVVEQVIKEYDLEMDNIDSSNGGRNRKIYFKLYYYPLKIMEWKGWIEYSGRGNIRLKI